MTRSGAELLTFQSNVELWAKGRVLEWARWPGREPTWDSCQWARTLHQHDCIKPCSVLTCCDFKSLNLSLLELPQLWNEDNNCRREQCIIIWALFHTYEALEIVFVTLLFKVGCYYLLKPSSSPLPDLELTVYASVSNKSGPLKGVTNTFSTSYHDPINSTSIVKYRLFMPLCQVLNTHTTHTRVL